MFKSDHVKREIKCKYIKNYNKNQFQGKYFTYINI